MADCSCHFQLTATASSGCAKNLRGVRMRKTKYNRNMFSPKSTSHEYTTLKNQSMKFIRNRGQNMSGVARGFGVQPPPSICIQLDLQRFTIVLCNASKPAAKYFEKLLSVLYSGEPKDGMV